MEELIKTSFQTYIDLALFAGLLIALFTAGFIMKTKKMENTKLKIALRVVVCSALVGLWAYHFVYVNAYPISLAYYEYKNNIAEEKVGVIDSMEQEGKDRVRITIDDTDYTIVYSSQKPYANGTKGIKQGDSVRVLVGEHSGYIFDIQKADSKSYAIL